MRNLKNNQKQVDAAPRRLLLSLFRKLAAAACGLMVAALIPPQLQAEVPHGTQEGATNYYKAFSLTNGFSTPDQIFQTTLDDVADYMGFHGFTGADLQNLPPDVLMHPDKSLSASNAPTAASVFQHADVLQSTTILDHFVCEPLAGVGFIIHYKNAVGRLVVALG